MDAVPPPVCVTGWFGHYCQMHNIARGKPASQSSTWPDTTGTYDASLAVDGDVNTHLDHGSCSHTDEPNSGPASWQVLLGGTFLISRITIYLRDDSIDHNEAMEILVSGNTCGKLPVADIRDSTTHLITNPVTLSCTEPTEGDNVTIVMAGPYLALCEVQVFGKMKESCHCSNGCSDFPNIACSTPSSGTVCKSPWFGSFCQMENIAFQKTARQSSTYDDGVPYCAAHAVDGNTDTDLSHRSCSHTDEADTSVLKASWQVLLDGHQMFNISRIRIFLRSEQEDHNKDMTVLVNGGVCNSVSGTTLQGKLRSDSNPFDVTCKLVMKGNNVTITMRGQYLTLCEVQVFVCSDGWFGSDCDKQCQCLNTSEVCDKDTGYCKSGCAARKQGQGCQDCVDGYYGGNCLQLCGSCKDGTHCNKSNGECPQECKTNFQTPYCKDCEDGYYGGKCSQQCGSCKDGTHCNKSNGECPQGCKTNFQTPHCKDCEGGYYGGNCSQQCGSCKDGTHCNKSNGECLQGCKTNFETPHCKDCEDGYYGGNCSQQCGSCKDGTHFNKSNGECLQGCKTNFQAPHCKVCKEGLFGTDCSKHCKCINRTETCDKVTGNCRSGCPAGIRGSGCQEECADYTYGFNCSGVCSCLNQCEVCEKMTGECQTGYHTTTAEKSTAIPLKNENIGHKTDVRFIVVCCLMVVLGVYSAAATTLVFSLKRKNAKTQAELEKQYMSLETRGGSSVYDVIDGTHTYSNHVQPENSVYENTTRRVMKRDEHSL